MNRKSKKTVKTYKDTLHTPKERIVTLLVALLFGVGVFAFTYNGIMAYPEQLAQDMAYKSDEPMNNNIKIIAIDDKSMAVLGDYALWSRQVYADLINTLCSEGNKPAVIGFDIMFFTERDEKGDAAFVEACVNADNVVVASQLNISQHNNLYVPEDSDILYYEGAVSKPYDALNEVVNLGYVDIILDNDGFVRHSLLRVDTSQGVQYSLATAMARLYCEKEGIEFTEPTVDSTGSMLIHYIAPPGSYEYISLSDVITGEVPASVFDGAIVLVGSYTEGMMDSYNVMVDRRSRMFGVEINANIIQNLISGEQLTRPDIFVVSVIYGVIAVILLYITNRKKITFLTIVMLSSLVLHLACCFILYRTIGMMCYITYLCVALLVIYIVNIIWKYTYERIERERELKLLLYSMAEAMTEAIDQRTPYNASHTVNVAKYSVDLGNYINLQYKKKRTKLKLTSNELNQLKLAALLHDVGKMSVPLEVLDKPTRLGAHKEDIMARFEKIELLCKLDIAESTLHNNKENNSKITELQDKLMELESLRNQVLDFDKKEFLSDEDKSCLETIIDREYVSKAGDKIPYFTPEEIECLMIPKGTLTAEEMEQVHHHAVYTDEILEKIRFGKDYDKVRAMAASHHELLNGKGYPKHLQGDEIDISTRILTICDVYDALTADDRPYKKAKTKEQTFKILGFMAKDGEIDEEILEFAKELWAD